MKVYVSASKHDRAREAAALIGAVWGHEVVSRWHADGVERPPRKDAAAWAERVAGNLADLGRADVLVCLPALNANGTHLELGYALRGGTPAVVLTERLTTPFLHHPLVTVVKSADELEQRLKELAEAVTAKPKKVTRKKAAVK